MNFDKTVYIETSVVSYLTAVVSSNPSKIARHYASSEWLDFWGPGFELYTSDVAIEGTDREHRRGGALPEAMEGVTKLPITNAVNALADALIGEEALPPDSRNNAVHVALAAVHGINYLLTWKSHLLDKEVTVPLMREVCERRGYRSAETCTPHALVGEKPIYYDDILEEVWEIRYNNYHEERLGDSYQARGEPVPSIDVPARLKEFREVEHGWLDGEGMAPSHDGLDWLVGAWESHLAAEAAPTRCYLTRDGCVRMEWSIGSFFMSFEVDLLLHTGGFFWHDSESRDYDSGELDLDKASSWEWLVSEVRDKQAQDDERNASSANTSPPDSLYDGLKSQ